MAPALSYCVVNTNGREHLLACLEAIDRTHPADIAAELIVLENGSDDGSAEAASRWAKSAGGVGASLRLIERADRRGKAENDSVLLREAEGEFCLLLNEDSEPRPGATEALIEVLEQDPGAAAAGARLLDPAGVPQPSAWRLPGLGTAVAGAVFLHRLYTVESRGERTRAVGWVQSAAMLVRRRAAEEVGYLDPEFFVYSDETDFCKRLHDAGWRILYVPDAEAVHHEQLATDRGAGERRVVEFHRGRDLYMRKHHSPAVAEIARVLGALPYLLRAIAARLLPGHDPGWYLLHARQALRPSRGEGLREAAEARNRRLAARR